MKKMVFILLGMGLLALEAPQGASARENKPPLKVLVETSKQKDGPTVKFTIVNESKTYQLYQGMSCSWQDCWTTDDKHAQLEGTAECGKNAPVTVILAPGEKYAEPTHPLALRGTPGKHKLRFGYVRHVSTFTSDQLEKLYHSKDQGTRFYAPFAAEHFKRATETFWSAPTVVEVLPPSLM